MNNFFALLMLSFAIVSCDDKELVATREDVEGMYTGQLPTGEIELWQLDASGGFTQKLFVNEAKYLMNEAEHSFTSSWRIENERLWISQSLEHFDQHPPFKIKSPETVNWTTWVLWMSSGFGSERPIIVLSDDSGVIYKKVRERNDNVRVFGWEGR